MDGSCEWKVDPRNLFFFFTLNPSYPTKRRGNKKKKHDKILLDQKKGIWTKKKSKEFGLDGKKKICCELWVIWKLLMKKIYIKTLPRLLLGVPIGFAGIFP